MGNKRSAAMVAGIGGIMLSVCIACALIHFNEWTKTHADRVTQGMYLSGLLAMVCFLVWFQLHGETTEGAERQASSAISVTASPVISPTISPVFAPVFNNHLSSPLPTPELVPSRYDLLILSWHRNITIVGPYPEGAEWAQVDGLTAQVYGVKYMRPTDGSLRPGVATHICASLRFSNGSTFTPVNIEKVLWLGQEGTDTSIPIGETREFIVGINTERSWITVQNGNKSKPILQGIPFWDDSTGWNNHFQVDVTVFSSQSGEVFASKTHHYRSYTHLAYGTG